MQALMFAVGTTTSTAAAPPPPRPPPAIDGNSRSNETLPPAPGPPPSPSTTSSTKNGVTRIRTKSFRSRDRMKQTQSQDVRSIASTTTATTTTPSTAKKANGSANHNDSPNGLGSSNSNSSISGGTTTSATTTTTTAAGGGGGNNPTSSTSNSIGDITTTTTTTTTTKCTKETNLAKKLEQHFKTAESLRSSKHYKEAIEEYRQCGMIWECSIGRYHVDTANVYTWIGFCHYHRKEYKQASIAYRTRFRIIRYLSEDKKDPKLDQATSPNAYDSLKQQGLTETEVKVWDSILTKSIKSEKAGDFHRSKGEFEQAMEHYVEAIVWEKQCIGNEETLANLWRKMCSISGKNNDTLVGLTTDWSQVDRSVTMTLTMPTTTTTTTTTIMTVEDYVKQMQDRMGGMFSRAVIPCLARGDKHYTEGRYQEALQDYHTAVEASKSTITKPKRQQQRQQVAANDNDKAMMEVRSTTSTSSDDTTDDDEEEEYLSESGSSCNPHDDKRNKNNKNNKKNIRHHYKAKNRTNGNDNQLALGAFQVLVQDQSDRIRRLERKLEEMEHALSEQPRQHSPQELPESFTNLLKQVSEKIDFMEETILVSKFCRNCGSEGGKRR